MLNRNPPRRRSLENSRRWRRERRDDTQPPRTPDQHIPVSIPYYDAPHGDAGPSRAPPPPAARNRASSDTSSLGSSTSSSLLNISRPGLLSGFAAFFSPSTQKKQRRVKKKKRNFLRFGNSSSSSVGSDLAYGRGYIKRRSSRSFSPPSGRKPRRESEELGRPVPKREQTDEEIIALGKKFAAIAKHQNTHDLKTSGRTKPAAILGAVAAIHQMQRKSSGKLDQRGLGSSRPQRESSPDDSEWESASEDESSSGSSDSGLVYGSAARLPGVFSQPAAPSSDSRYHLGADFNRPLNRKPSLVDPQLFGPINSLRGYVQTPCGFDSVQNTPSNEMPPIPGTTSFDNLPLQHVYPIPTSDPGRFDAGRGSVVSVRPDSSSGRPAPVPLQQPKPIVPVPTRVFEARAENNDPYAKRTSSGKVLAGAVATALAGAAAGKALASDSRDDESRRSRDDRRRDEQQEIMPWRVQGDGRPADKERRRREREQRDLDDPREYAYDSRRQNKRDDQYRAEEYSDRRDRPYDKYADQKRADKYNDIRDRPWDRDDDRYRAQDNAYGETPDHYQGQFRGDGGKSDKKGKGVEYYKEAPRYVRSSKTDDDRRVKDSSDPSEFGPIDPFQSQVADDTFQTPSYQTQKRPLTPNVVSVDREPDFSKPINMNLFPTERLSRKDSYERDVRAAQEAHEAKYGSSKPITAAAVAAAVTASAVAGRQRRNTGGGDREVDPIQEQVDRQWREQEKSRKAEEEERRSRSNSPDPSVVDQWRWAKSADQRKGKVQSATIVEPPESPKTEPKKSPYDAPNADVRIDNILKHPVEIKKYQVPAGRQFLAWGGSVQPFKSRDPSAERERPLLNLVLPTPTPSPMPEQQIARAEPKQERPVVTPIDTSRTNDEYDDELQDSKTPATPRSVTWGTNSTKHYRVESPVRDGDPWSGPRIVEPAESKPRASRKSGWGAITAVMAGVGAAAAAATSSSSSEPSSSRSKQKTSISHDRPVSPVEEYYGSPPIPGPKPQSAAGKPMPGSFDEDPMFTASVAAGMEGSGFNPNMILEDAKFHKRSSPPRTEEQTPQARDRSSVFSELPARGAVENDLPASNSDIYSKLSKKDKRRIEKSAEAESPTASSVDYSSSSSKLSKKEQKRRDKAAARAAEETAEAESKARAKARVKAGAEAEAAAALRAEAEAEADKKARAKAKAAAAEAAEAEAKAETESKARAKARAAVAAGALAAAAAAATHKSAREPSPIRDEQEDSSSKTKSRKTKKEKAIIVQEDASQARDPLPAENPKTNESREISSPWASSPPSYRVEEPRLKSPERSVGRFQPPSWSQSSRDQTSVVEDESPKSEIPKSNHQALWDQINVIEDAPPKQEEVTTSRREITRAPDSWTSWARELPDVAVKSSTDPKTGATHVEVGPVTPPAERAVTETPRDNRTIAKTGGLPFLFNSEPPHTAEPSAGLPWLFNRDPAPSTALPAQIPRSVPQDYARADSKSSNKDKKDRKEKRSSLRYEYSPHSSPPRKQSQSPKRRSLDGTAAAASASAILAMVAAQNGREKSGSNTDQGTAHEYVNASRDAVKEDNPKDDFSFIKMTSEPASIEDEPGRLRDNDLDRGRKFDDGVSDVAPPSTVASFYTSGDSFPVNDITRETTIANEEDWDAVKKKSKKKKSSRESDVYSSHSRNNSFDTIKSNPFSDTKYLYDDEASALSTRSRRKSSKHEESPSRSDRDVAESSRSRSKKSKRDSASYGSPASSRPQSSERVSSSKGLADSHSDVRSERGRRDDDESKKSRRKSSRRDSEKYEVSPSRSEHRGSTSSSKKSKRHSGVHEESSSRRDQSVAASEASVSSRRSKRDVYPNSPSRSLTDLGDSEKRSKKEKRRSYPGVGTLADLDDDLKRRDETPDRGRDKYKLADNDASSVVSEPTRSTDKHSNGSKSRKKPDDDDDARSIASSPGGERREKKSSRSEKELREKRSSGGLGFFDRFKSSMGYAEEKERAASKMEDDKTSKEDKKSFLDNAGTLGAGVGLTGAAFAIASRFARPHASNTFTTTTTTKEQDDAPETTFSSRGMDSPLPQRDITDPEIFERQIRPAIDPQFGDLLPLPPSEPSSPTKDLGDLPPLADSRPETPKQVSQVLRPAAVIEAQASVPKEDLVDPEIVERHIRPAIDPQYGDLLPLPPSKPGSPVSEPGELPLLPDSRPDTPEHERQVRRGSFMSHSRKRSANDNSLKLPKTPSQSAVPLQFRLGTRQSPLSPGFLRPSPVVSPTATIFDQPPPVAPKLRSRPSSWEATKEFKPLYLLEKTSHDNQREAGPSTDELPGLPLSEPSEPASQASPDLSLIDEIDELPLDHHVPPLSLDTSLANEHVPDLDSAETTPKAELASRSFDDALSDALGDQIDTPSDSDVFESAVASPDLPSPAGQEQRKWSSFHDVFSTETTALNQGPYLPSSSPAHKISGSTLGEHSPSLHDAANRDVTGDSADGLAGQRKKDHSTAITAGLLGAATGAAVAYATLDTGEESAAEEFFDVVSPLSKENDFADSWNGLPSPPGAEPRAIEHAVKRELQPLETSYTHPIDGEEKTPVLQTSRAFAEEPLQALPVVPEATSIPLPDITPEEEDFLDLKPRDVRLPEATPDEVHFLDQKAHDTLLPEVTADEAELLDQKAQDILLPEVTQDEVDFLNEGPVDISLPEVTAAEVEFLNQHARDILLPEITKDEVAFLDPMVHDILLPEITEDEVEFLDQKAQDIALPEITEDEVSFLDQKAEDIVLPEITEDEDEFLNQKAHDILLPKITDDEVNFLDPKAHDILLPEVTKDEVDFLNQKAQDIVLPEITDEEVEFLDQKAHHILLPEITKDEVSFLDPQPRDIGLPIVTTEEIEFLDQKPQDLQLPEVTSEEAEFLNAKPQDIQLPEITTEELAFLDQKPRNIYLPAITADEIAFLDAQAQDIYLPEVTPDEVDFLNQKPHDIRLPEVTTDEVEFLDVQPHNVYLPAALADEAEYLDPRPHGILLPQVTTDEADLLKEADEEKLQLSAADVTLVISDDATARDRALVEPVEPSAARAMSTGPLVSPDVQLREVAEKRQATEPLGVEREDPSSSMQTPADLSSLDQHTPEVPMEGGERSNVTETPKAMVEAQVKLSKKELKRRKKLKAAEAAAAVVAASAAAVAMESEAQELELPANSSDLPGLPEADEEEAHDLAESAVLSEPLRDREIGIENTLPLEDSLPVIESLDRPASPPVSPSKKDLQRHEETEADAVTAAAKSVDPRIAEAQVDQSLPTALPEADVEENQTLNMPLVEPDTIGVPREEAIVPETKVATAPADLFESPSASPVKLLKKELKRRQKAASEAEAAAIATQATEAEHTLPSMDQSALQTLPQASSNVSRALVEPTDTLTAADVPKDNAVITEPQIPLDSVIASEVPASPTAALSKKELKRQRQAEAEAAIAAAVAADTLASAETPKELSVTDQTALPPLPNADEQESRDLTQPVEQLDLLEGAPERAKVAENEASLATIEPTSQPAEAVVVSTSPIKLSKKELKRRQKAEAEAANAAASAPLELPAARTAEPAVDQSLITALPEVDDQEARDLDGPTEQPAIPEEHHTVNVPAAAEASLETSQHRRQPAAAPETPPSPVKLSKKELKRQKKAEAAAAAAAAATTFAGATIAAGDQKNPEEQPAEPQPDQTDPLRPETDAQGPSDADASRGISINETESSNAAAQMKTLAEPTETAEVSLPPLESPSEKPRSFEKADKDVSTARALEDHSTDLSADLPLSTALPDVDELESIALAEGPEMPSTEFAQDEQPVPTAVNSDPGTEAVTQDKNKTASFPTEAPVAAGDVTTTVPGDEHLGVVAPDTTTKPTLADESNIGASTTELGGVQEQLSRDVIEEPAVTPVKLSKKEKRRLKKLEEDAAAETAKVSQAAPYSVPPQEATEEATEGLSAQAEGVAHIAQDGPRDQPALESKIAHSAEQDANQSVALEAPTSEVPPPQHQQPSENQSTQPPPVLEQDKPQQDPREILQEVEQPRPAIETVTEEDPELEALRALLFFKSPKPKRKANRTPSEADKASAPVAQLAEEQSASQLVESSPADQVSKEEISTTVDKRVELEAPVTEDDTRSAGPMQADKHALKAQDVVNDSPKAVESGAIQPAVPLAATPVEEVVQEGLSLNSGPLDSERTEPVPDKIAAIDSAALPEASHSPKPDVLGSVPRDAPIAVDLPRPEPVIVDIRSPEAIADDEELAVLTAKKEERGKLRIRERRRFEELTQKAATRAAELAECRQATVEAQPTRDAEDTKLTEPTTPASSRELPAGSQPGQAEAILAPTETTSNAPTDTFATERPATAEPDQFSPHIQQTSSNDLPTQDDTQVPPSDVDTVAGGELPRDDAMIIEQGSATTITENAVSERPEDASSNIETDLKTEHAAAEVVQEGTAASVHEAVSEQDISAEQTEPTTRTTNNFTEPIEPKALPAIAAVTDVPVAPVSEAIPGPLVDPHAKELLPVSVATPPASSEVAADAALQSDVPVKDPATIEMIMEEDPELDALRAKLFSKSKSKRKVKPVLDQTSAARAVASEQPADLPREIPTQESMADVPAPVETIATEPALSADLKKGEASKSLVVTEVVDPPYVAETGETSTTPAAVATALPSDVLFTPEELPLAKVKPDTSISGNDQALEPSERATVSEVHPDANVLQATIPAEVSQDIPIDKSELESTLFDNSNDAARSQSTPREILEDVRGGEDSVASSALVQPPPEVNLVEQSEEPVVLNASQEATTPAQVTATEPHAEAARDDPLEISRDSAIDTAEQTATLDQHGNAPSAAIIAEEAELAALQAKKEKNGKLKGTSKKRHLELTKKAEERAHARSSMLDPPAALAPETTAEALIVQEPAIPPPAAIIPADLALPDLNTVKDNVPSQAANQERQISGSALDPEQASTADTPDARTLSAADSLPQTGREQPFLETSTIAHEPHLEEIDRAHVVPNPVSREIGHRAEQAQDHIAISSEDLIATTGAEADKSVRKTSDETTPSEFVVDEPLGRASPEKFEQKTDNLDSSLAKHPDDSFAAVDLDSVPDNLAKEAQMPADLLVSPVVVPHAVSQEPGPASKVVLPTTELSKNQDEHPSSISEPTSLMPKSNEEDMSVLAEQEELVALTAKKEKRGKLKRKDRERFEELTQSAKLRADIAPRGRESALPLSQDSVVTGRDNAEVSAMPSLVTETPTKDQIPTADLDAGPNTGLSPFGASMVATMPTTEDPEPAVPVTVSQPLVESEDTRLQSTTTPLERYEPSSVPDPPIAAEEEAQADLVVMSQDNGNLESRDQKDIEQLSTTNEQHTTDHATRDLEQDQDALPGLAASADHQAPDDISTLASQGPASEETLQPTVKAIDRDSITETPNHEAVSSASKDRASEASQLDPGLTNVEVNDFGRTLTIDQPSVSQLTEDERVELEQLSTKRASKGKLKSKERRRFEELSSRAEALSHEREVTTDQKPLEAPKPDIALDEPLQELVPLSQATVGAEEASQDIHSADDQTNSAIDSKIAVSDSQTILGVSQTTPQHIEPHIAPDVSNANGAFPAEVTETREDLLSMPQEPIAEPTAPVPAADDVELQALEAKLATRGKLKLKERARLQELQQISKARQLPDQAIDLHEELHTPEPKQPALVEVEQSVPLATPLSPPTAQEEPNSTSVEPAKPAVETAPVLPPIQESPRTVIDPVENALVPVAEPHASDSSSAQPAAAVLREDSAADEDLTVMEIDPELEMLRAQLFSKSNTKRKSHAKKRSEHLPTIDEARQALTSGPEVKAQESALEPTQVREETSHLSAAVPETVATDDAPRVGNDRPADTVSGELEALEAKLAKRGKLKSKDRKRLEELRSNAKHGEDEQTVNITQEAITGPPATTEHPVSNLEGSGKAQPTATDTLLMTPDEQPAKERFTDPVPIMTGSQVTIASPSTTVRDTPVQPIAEASTVQSSITVDIQAEQEELAALTAKKIRKGKLKSKDRKRLEELVNRLSRRNSVDDVPKDVADRSNQQPVSQAEENGPAVQSRGVPSPIEPDAAAAPSTSAPLEHTIQDTLPPVEQYRVASPHHFEAVEHLPATVSNQDSPLPEPTAPVGASTQVAERVTEPIDIAVPPSQAPGPSEDEEPQPVLSQEPAALEAEIPLQDSSSPTLSAFPTTEAEKTGTKVAGGQTIVDTAPTPVEVPANPREEEEEFAALRKKKELKGRLKGKDKRRFEELKSTINQRAGSNATPDVAQAEPPVTKAEPIPVARGIGESSDPAQTDKIQHDQVESPSNVDVPDTTLASVEPAPSSDLAHHQQPSYSHEGGASPSSSPALKEPLREAVNSSSAFEDVPALPLTPNVADKPKLSAVGAPPVNEVAMDMKQSETAEEEKPYSPLQKSSIEPATQLEERSSLVDKVATSPKVDVLPVDAHPDEYHEPQSARFPLHQDKDVSGAARSLKPPTVLAQVPAWGWTSIENEPKEALHEIKDDNDTEHSGLDHLPRSDSAVDLNVIEKDTTATSAVIPEQPVEQNPSVEIELPLDSANQDKQKQHTSGDSAKLRERLLQTTASEQDNQPLTPTSARRSVFDFLSRKNPLGTVASQPISAPTKDAQLLEGSSKDAPILPKKDQAQGKLGASETRPILEAKPPRQREVPPSPLTAPHVDLEPARPASHIEHERPVEEPSRASKKTRTRTVLSVNDGNVVGGGLLEGAPDSVAVSLVREEEGGLLPPLLCEADDHLMTIEPSNQQSPTIEHFEMVTDESDTIPIARPVPKVESPVATPAKDLAAAYLAGEPLEGRHKKDKTQMQPHRLSPEPITPAKDFAATYLESMTSHKDRDTKLAAPTAADMKTVHESKSTPSREVAANLLESRFGAGNRDRDVPKDSSSAPDNVVATATAGAWGAAAYSALMSLPGASKGEEKRIEFDLTPEKQDEDNATARAVDGMAPRGSGREQTKRAWVSPQESENGCGEEREEQQSESSVKRNTIQWPNDVRVSEDPEMIDEAESPVRGRATTPNTRRVRRAARAERESTRNDRYMGDWDTLDTSEQMEEEEGVRRNDDSSRHATQASSLSSRRSTIGKAPTPSLAPVVEEVHEEPVRARKKQQMRGNFNRDSGLATNSPQPSQRSNDIDTEGHRDSGVHTRGVHEPSDGSNREAAIFDNQEPAVQTPQRDNKRRAQKSITGEGAPVLQTPTRERERRHEDMPESSKTSEPVTEVYSTVSSNRRSSKSPPKTSKYGELGQLSSPGLGPGSPRSSRILEPHEQRSISDNLGRRGSPRLENTPPAMRRTASNSSLSRLRTPEPLSFRPDSPGLRGLRSTTATPPLRRADRRASGDLRSMGGQQGGSANTSHSHSRSLSHTQTGGPDNKDINKGQPHSSAEAGQAAQTASAGTLLGAAAVAAGAIAATASSSTTSNKNSTPVANEGRARSSKDMADIYDGFGEGRMGSPRSPTRPHSMRRRQSMQVIELESRVEALIAENQNLQHQTSQAEQVSARTAATKAERDAEIELLRASLESLQREVTRLSQVNDGLQSANSLLAMRHTEKYGHLESQHANVARELEQQRVSKDNYASELQNKDAEIARLRKQLETTKEQVREMQRQILASKPPDAEFLRLKDEDHFDKRCQQLCSHVQQWVLRFSKFSDMRACRLTSEINDEKIIDKLDNTLLDGTDVDDYLGDRVRRRDVFMSMTMNMIWEFVFTRYLFGMDREQRQKLKSVEKLLQEVGPPQAVRQWRAVTLTLLSKRPAFGDQRNQDTEAVVQAILQTLSMILPPPSHLENQIQSQLRRVLRDAVDLSIEMRTQKAEYMMLPPLQPEYDANGDLAETVKFNGALMNERSGDTMTNEELESQGAVVRFVLFPLVVKKGDDNGVGDDEIVVCPAQVLVAKSRSLRGVNPSLLGSDTGTSIGRGATPSVYGRSTLSVNMTDAPPSDN